MTLSGLVAIVIVLIVIGVALWLIEHYIPLDPPIRIIIRVVVVLAVVLWLLYQFGLFAGPAPVLRR